MPDDPLVWIVVVGVVALLVLFALVKGKIVKLKAGNYGLEFERNQPAEPSGISVASGLTVHGKTGDIAGVKVSEGSADVGGPIEVARDAHIDGTTGDIVGVKRGGPASGR